MFVAMTQGWKLVLTLALLCAILCSVVLRAPRQRIADHELRHLVLAAVALYGVGALASLAHDSILAGLVYASGILICSLAVWLSRGADPGDGPDGPGGNEPPGDEHPPPGPDGLPAFDWDEFERELARYSGREPVNS